MAWQKITSTFSFFLFFPYSVEIFCYIINVFTVTFDQFNGSFLIKKKITLTPNFYL